MSFSVSPTVLRGTSPIKLCCPSPPCVFLLICHNLLSGEQSPFEVLFLTHHKKCELSSSVDKMCCFLHDRCFFFLSAVSAQPKLAFGVFGGFSPDLNLFNKKVLRGVITFRLVSQFFVLSYHLFLCFVCFNHHVIWSNPGKNLFFFFLLSAAKITTELLQLIV